MNSSWQDFLETKNARVENAIVADFGDSQAEFAAAQHKAVVCPLAHLGLIECAGEDAKSFLHNQLTSDVNHLEPGTAQHSAWCTAKGRMQVSFVLYHQGPLYRALLSADLVPATLKRLQMFVLRSKVKLSDLSASQELIGVAGPDAGSVLRTAGLPVPGKVLETAEFAAGLVIGLESCRFVVVANSSAAAQVWEALAAHASPAGTPIWNWLDIQAGIPLISEATKEEFVPQMANFDKIGGVSFHKGCYPGQEVVARAQYLGKIKRHLYRIQSDAPIKAGTAVFAKENPEQSCGTVANAAPAPGGAYAALAVIQEGFVDSGDLTLESAGGKPITKIEMV